MSALPWVEKLLLALSPPSGRGGSWGSARAEGYLDGKYCPLPTTRRPTTILGAKPCTASAEKSELLLALMDCGHQLQRCGQHGWRSHRHCRCSWRASTSPHQRWLGVVSCRDLDITSHSSLCRCFVSSVGCPITATVLITAGDG